MNTQKFIIASTESLLAALLAVAIVAVGFFVVEPQVGQAVVSNPFTIKTTITDEISFLGTISNVTATGSINGITGGTANGSTTVVVQTNASLGYRMSIAFTDNGSGQAMQGDASDSDSIRDYPAVSSTTPTFLFSTASTSAVFGYTVSAAEPADLSPAFKDNGSACNTGTGFTADRCWMEPTVTGFQIINRDNSATNGATTTLHFRIHVPNNPTPGLVADIYTATATLTALNN